MADTAQKRADRSKSIGFRVSEKLYSQILAQASVKDLGISEYLRFIVTKTIDDERQMQAVIARRKR